MKQDVIIVGGGFAGVTTAREIALRGRSVLLLEARDRLGGRTWTRPFAGRERHVELGGAWINTRYQRHVAAAIDRHGIGVERERGSPTPFQWRFDGVSARAFPLRGGEIYELERALHRIVAASRRIDVAIPRDEQDLADLDVSVDEFLGGLELSPRCRAFLAGFGALGSGAAAADWSALTAFSLIAAFGNSAYAWYAAVTDTFAGGTGAVVEALATGLEVRLGSPVAAIEQRDDDVAVRGACGAETVAGAVVLAVPVNAWAQIAFEPALSAAKQEVAGTGHPNRMAKVWALVSGAPADAAAFGPASELLYLAPQYELPEGLLMVGFSSPPHPLDVADPAAIERAVREHHPGAAVIAADAHDWNADPWSRGGWMTWRPRQASRLMSSLARVEGRVAFAGADIATAWIGWLDGALESGARAAAEALRVLDGGPRPIAVTSV